MIIYNYFTWKLRESYQGFPRPIPPTKHQERREGCFECNIGMHLHYTLKCDYSNGELICSYTVNELFILYQIHSVNCQGH